MVLARRRFLGALACLAACRRGHVALRVAAASSLAPVLDALRATASQSVRLPVEMVYGATGILARQIENGAPFDVFASADRETPERLERDGHLVRGSSRAFARGRLVLFVPHEQEGVVHGLSDVVDRRIARIAIANPDVAPFGRAAEEVLVHARLAAIVHDRVVMAENVRQAYEFVTSGNADVAFTSASVVSTQRGRSVRIDPGTYTPIDEVAGVVTHAANGAAARAYLDLLTGPLGRAALDQHGFDLP